ncbi:rhamnogalacturonan acetylesterase [Halobacillus sp. A5]|uniref:rhamnogalacturonan acetylesterase n=1 Tax=Halobacillus sp. A5 TaxID=2880263 RepID=UPI0020A6992E|nr:rhamnogalacturonan acetylesterase [Halobacillus sp. A5]MCP3028945.1 rhamnogalacturonan acetylesterase [Halobacillus sp. A5]
MDKIEIYLAGDSTVADHEPASSPQAGWGQLLPQFFTNEVSICNKAVNGRSSKSFIHEGRLSAISEQLSSGDYLFFQFGHNDSKPDEARHTEPFSSYRHYLLKYIETARANDAVPVLITPLQRRKFTPDGCLYETYEDYPEAARQLASEQGVHLIDLTEQSTKLLLNLGPEKAKQLFMWLDKNSSPHYPDGVRDDTHLNKDGAKEVAEIVVGAVARLPIRLADHVRLPHQKSN